MKIRSESYPWVVGTLIPAAVAYGLWIYSMSYLVLGLFILLTGLGIFFLYFFRDPDRTPNFQDNTGTSDSERHWLAPADGIVSSVKDEEDGRKRIVIFLTVFNVHVNRMPVSGMIQGQEYREGRFLPAFAENLEQRNERNKIICEDTFGRNFEVWQIAGMLARRIHFWPEIDDKFNQGNRFGMISLGSRTDLILPEEVSPTVTDKQNVRAGQTVIAKG